MRDVFISYSHKDEQWVNDVLVPQLRAADVDVLIDAEDFVPGPAAIQNMANAVAGCQRTLVVLTPNWVASEWTQYEGLLTAYDDPSGARGKMIPILRAKCDPPKWLAIRSWLDFADDARVSQQMARLIRAIKRGPDAAAVKIDVVNEGLRTLADLIAGGPARDALLEFRFRFDNIAGRIDRMATWKEVHDQLHHVQLHCYDRVIADVPRLGKEELVVDAMMQYCDTLQQSIDRLRQLSAKPLFDNAKLTWLATLERAQKLLCEGIDATDPDLVKNAAKLIDRVLASEPPRIDARLSGAACELELGAVIDAVAVVCTLAKEKQLHEAKLDKLEEALAEMERLDDTLQELVRNHTLWQDVDVVMRRVDTNLDTDTFELVDSWPDLKKQVAVLTAATTEWAKGIGKLADSVEKSIAEQDAGGMARHFRRYRQRAVLRFFAVDTDLNEQCRELRKAGDPLAAIVQALA
ncbi:MAG TPA: toll/interleukin-1 receptor domain-containing protein [Thermoanaerobaculia bacterium]|nr:toll/interleukin-1 receptor domain-containing protein [Thermoanaerobaculia bacterium]